MIATPQLARPASTGHSTLAQLDLAIFYDGDGAKSDLPAYSGDAGGPQNSPITAEPCPLICLNTSANQLVSLRGTGARYSG